MLTAAVFIIGAVCGWFLNSFVSCMIGVLAYEREDDMVDPYDAKIIRELEERNTSEGPL